MNGLWLTGGSITYRTDLIIPEPGPGEALLKVRLAGICATDLELLRGYKGWQGVPGHEFVADVAAVGAGADPALVGQRVVGEINAGCGTCDLCRAGDPRHCPDRTALGIFGRNGAFGEYCALPTANLLPVPESLSDEEAVFTEPLAAALEILEQVHIRPGDSACVIGDGRLGCLVAQTLRLTGADVRIQGRRPDRLACLAAMGVRPPADGQRFGLVVDCTGRPDGLAAARARVAPRGRIVLKSTYHGTVEADLSSFVVDEVTLTGSRCGPFAPALRLLEQGLVDIHWMISGTYPLAEGDAAFEAARGSLKVLLRP